MPIYFYSTQEQPYGCFSNFSRHGFSIDDIYWPTSEHYFQAQKFAGLPDEEQIRHAATAKIAAQWGRERKRPLRPDWEAVKDDIMRWAVRCKFEAHPSIRAVLLGTGEEVIIEAAPGDYYWGCGADGSGKNMLGLILMEVRTLLRNATA